MSNKDKIITELLEKTQQMQEHMEWQEKTIQILLKSNKQIIDWVDDIVKDQEHFRENYFFEISDPRLKEEVTEYWYPDIASVEETLDEIVLLQDLEMVNLPQFMGGYVTSSKRNRMTGLLHGCWTFLHRKMTD